MCLPEFADANPEAVIFVPGIEIAEIPENLDCQVIALRLLGRDQGLNFGPQVRFAASDGIKALFPGYGSLMFAAFCLLGSLLGLHPAPLLSVHVSVPKQFANSSARQRCLGPTTASLFAVSLEQLTITARSPSTTSWANTLSFPRLEVGQSTGRPQRAWVSRQPWMHWPAQPHAQDRDRWAGTQPDSPVTR